MAYEMPLGGGIHRISSLQRGAQPLLQSRFQEEPRCRSRREARSLRGIRVSYPALDETGSNTSDSPGSWVKATVTFSGLDPWSNSRGYDVIKTDDMSPPKA